MAFDPLATAADLAARNIVLPDGLDADALLAAASASVRDAAGCPISQATSTVPLIADSCDVVELPGLPVTSVASVLVEGVTVAPSTLVNGCWSAGWRASGHRVLLKCQRFELPATVTVTYTHGLSTVPADIVDLVCGLVSIAGTSDVYGLAGAQQSVKLGDFAESYARAGDDSVSPVGIPDHVRLRLRARFGTSAVAVGLGR